MTRPEWFTTRTVPAKPLTLAGLQSGIDALKAAVRPECEHVVSPKRYRDGGYGRCGNCGRLVFVEPHPDA